MHQKKLTLLAAIGLFLFNSCSKEDTEQQFVHDNDCDCKGKISTTVTNRAARLTVGKILYLKQVDSSNVVYMGLSPCDTLKIAGLPASQDGEYNYVVSGDLRPPCVTNGVAYLWSINISSISRK